MSTNAALPSGQFITTLGGKRCTAVPRNGGGTNTTSTTTSTADAANNNSNNSNLSSTTPVVESTTSSDTSTTSTSFTSSSTTLLQSTPTSTSSSSSSSSPSSISSSSSSSSSIQETNVVLAPPAIETTTDSAGTITTTETNTILLPSPPIPPQTSALSTTVTPSSVATVSSAQADTGSGATPATVASTTAATDTTPAFVSDSTVAVSIESTPDTTVDTGSGTTGTGTTSLFGHTSPTVTNGGSNVLSTIAPPPGVATNDGSSTSVAGAAANPAVGASSGEASTPASSTGTNTTTTIAIAGGVVGGVALLSLVAFLVWFWRRRVIKKRRSTLLTPLSVDPSFGGAGEAGRDSNIGRRNNAENEKEEYEINRGSIGPTARTVRMKASFDYNLRRIRNRVSAIIPNSGHSGRDGSASSNAALRAVNMDRGNSQFMEASDIRRAGERNEESSSRGIGGAGTATKGRIGGWFSQVTGGRWLSRGGSSEDSNGNEKSKSGSNDSSENSGTQTKFLTLLGMDERELERAAQNKKNVNRKKLRSIDRRSLARSDGAGESSGGNNFLGRLDFDDPFSDANALARHSAKPAPSMAGASGNGNGNDDSNNPFSDSNALPSNDSRYKNSEPTLSALQPSTYLADMRHSRSHDVSQQQPPPSAATRGESIMYRDSVNTMDTRRNRFRSDPFDLERPELLMGRGVGHAPATSSNMGTAGSSSPRSLELSGLSAAATSRLSGDVGTGDVRRPVRVVTSNMSQHQRSDSFTSKYSSGVGLGDWSDPGPDVGPSGNSRSGSSNSQQWEDDDYEVSPESSTTRNGIGGRASGGGKQDLLTRRQDTNSAGGSVGKAL